MISRPVLSKYISLPCNIRFLLCEYSIQMYSYVENNETLKGLSKHNTIDDRTSSPANSGGFLLAIAHTLHDLPQS